MIFTLPKYPQTRCNDARHGHSTFPHRIEGLDPRRRLMPHYLSKYAALTIELGLVECRPLLLHRFARHQILYV